MKVWQFALVFALLVALIVFGISGAVLSTRECVDRKGYMDNGLCISEDGRVIKLYEDK